MNKPRPICKIAQVTGDVPLECLFECKLNCVTDDLLTMESNVIVDTPIDDSVFKDFYKK